MLKKISKNFERQRRHARVRTKVTGTPERPRLNVFRSNSNIHAQLIDDVAGMKLEKGGNIDAAKAVGAEIAKRALEAKISEVVFDRGGYLYHGRVKALAEAAREAGLKF
jgi:large subunit ribosomal protein L18